MSEVKLPIPITEEFLKYVKYRFTKTSHIILEAKGKKKKPSLESGKSYWVPEDYRLVTDSNGTKLIQYHSDIFHKEKPKWVEASKMKKDYARYILECVKIEEKDIKKIGKKEAMLTGVNPERMYDADDADITDEFKRKALELWRLKCKWDKYAKEGEMYLDNPEVFVYHVVVHRVKPEYKNYQDLHWTE